MTGLEQRPATHRSWVHGSASKQSPGPKHEVQPPIAVFWHMFDVSHESMVQASRSSHSVAEVQHGGPSAV